MWTYRKCLGLTQKKNRSLEPICARLPASASPVLKQSWLCLQNLHSPAQQHRLTQTSHGGELTRFRKVDSIVDLRSLVHVPLILHHPTSEHHGSCTCHTTFQFWPPKNPEQWCKAEGLKKKRLLQFLLPHPTPTMACLWLSSIYCRSSVYSRIFLWQHELKTGNSG